MHLLASQLTEKGEQIALPIAPGAAVGLATGSGIPKNPKQWVCEDSLALHAVSGGWLAMVADAHFGGTASEAIAMPVLKAFESTQGPIDHRLHKTLRELDSHLHLDRINASETTALLVHLQGDLLTWASVGDSLLLICDRDMCEHVNAYPRCPLPFLGRVPWYDTLSPDEGQLRLARGSVALLATDGIETDVSALTGPEIASTLTGEGPLISRIQALLDSFDDVERGGGRDNLAVVALEPC